MQKISIIMATYNASATLREALQSFLDQTYKNVEIIISDGGSIDDTFSIVEEFSDKLDIEFNSEPDNGIYDAWNKGLERCTGDWILFLGADDKFSENCILSEIVDFIGKSNNSNLVTITGGVMDSTRSFVIKKIGEPFSAKILNRMTLCHPGLMHHKSIFLNKRFDYSFKICADYDFIVKNYTLFKPVHFEKISVLIGGDGVSRKYILKTLVETLSIQLSGGYMSSLQAYFNFFVAYSKSILRGIK